MKTVEVTTATFRAALAGTRQKYGNVRDGGFDSLAEARRYAELTLMHQAGSIGPVEVHPRYELQPAFVDRQGRRHRDIVYEADFAYTEGGVAVVEDVKGHATKDYLIKAKLFRFRYPAIDYRVLKV